MSNVNPPSYTFEEPIGTIRVDVLTAEENDSRRLAPELQPRIRVDATLTVRGVAYRVFAKYRWERTGHAVYSHGNPTGAHTYWQEIDSQYTRVDSGKRPDYSTPTYRTLYDTVWRVLGRLVADHPEWQHASLVARLRKLAAESEQTAASARYQWMEATTRAAALRGELATALLDHSAGVSGVCQHCDQPVRLSVDPSVPWVHTQTGNGYCDVYVPVDAVMLAGTSGRTEASPLAQSIQGEQS